METGFTLIVIGLNYSYLTKLNVFFFFNDFFFIKKYNKEKEKIKKL